MAGIEFVSGGSGQDIKPCRVLLRHGEQAATGKAQRDKHKKRMAKNLEKTGVHTRKKGC
jgi:hypothetical protein